jgi:hypothetical protein
MQLAAGYRFCTAPRFASALSWSERLQLNGGVTRTEAGFIAESTWHTATDSELSVLVAGETTKPLAPAAKDSAAARLPSVASKTATSEDRGPSGESWRHDLCVFAIPDHLRAVWWELAAKQVETLPAGLEGLEPFARAVADFAQFKGVPLPPQCAFEVTLTPPVDAATSTNTSTITAGGRGALLRLSRAADADAASSREIARVNLGDERTSLIFLNLRSSRIAEMLADRPRSAESTTRVEHGDVVRSFLSHFPAYPLVRLVLEPGEGVWLPDADVIYDDDRSGKSDMDVWLILRQAEG